MHPAGAALAPPRLRRALALPRAAGHIRLARHQGALQADVPRRRLGAARAGLHRGRLRRRLREVREVPVRQHAVPDPRLLRACSRCSTSPPRSHVSSISLVVQRQPRDEGLLPARAASPRRRARRRSSTSCSACSCSSALMARYRHVADRPGSSCLRRVFILLALVTALGVGFVLSALNVRYRDVPYVIPVFMQVLPLLSGVPYALDRDPGEVAVDPLAQPDDGRHRRLALGDPRRPGARPRPDRGQRRRRDPASSSVGLAFFRRSEPRFADTI